MGYINENLRAHSNLIRNCKELRITLNGEKWLTGDKRSVCILWNNLTGCNHQSRQSHVDYFSICPEITNEDVISLVCDGKIKHSIKIKELNLWKDV